MSERLSVSVRVRPFLPHESLASCVRVTQNQISVGESRTFAFDRVFGVGATSDDVYVAVGQSLADAFLSGYHASTIAYGQTGAGKTFTMAALLHDTIQEIFCRLTEDTEAEAEGDASGAKRGASPAGPSGLPPTNETATVTASSSSAVTPPSHPSAFTLSLTVLEVYNETIGDLLSAHGALGTGGAGRRSTSSGNHHNGSDKRGSGATGTSTVSRNATPPLHRHALQLREDPSGGVYVVGLTEVPVTDEAMLLSCIEDAIGNRKTASTLMNATSSRSHCVVTLTLQRRGLCSRCCFVDLAGSERLKKSLGLGAPLERQHSLKANTGNGSGAASSDNSGFGGTAASSAAANVAVRMREGININSGLLALGNVIVALCERRPHVPYRASKLTRLLQPLLEGNSRTAMIACVAPLASSLEETLNTLKYADRAKQIHIDPRLAVAPSYNVADAEHLIFMLREQLDEARRRLAEATAHGKDGSAGANSRATNGRNPPPAPDLLAPTPAEVERLRHLLVEEQRVTHRLESDLFNAEYTAMVEVERRKAAEAKVAQLQSLLALGEQQQHLREKDSGNGRSPSLDGSPPAAHLLLTQNLARLQQLEEERASLAQLRERRMRDTQLLEAALATGENVAHVSRHGDGDPSNESTDTVDSDDAATVEQLTAEIQHKEELIAGLQRENEDVSAQLLQYEKDLHATVQEKAKLQAELRKAEAQLEKSAMEKDQRDQERARLQSVYVDRIRRAEEKAAEYRRRVSEAEQEMKTRQENIQRTRQLQEKVMALREEVTRQRQMVRQTKKQSAQLSHTHQQEVGQLQRQLQLSNAQLTQLQRRMERRDEAIAKVQRQLAEQQQSAEQQTPVAVTPHVPLHRIPQHKVATGWQATPTKPSAAAAAEGGSHQAFETPASDPPSSEARSPVPVVIVKRRAPSSSAARSPTPTALFSASHADVSQAQIDRELCALADMEKELGELQEYRQVLLSAQETDAPKWHRAREGFTRRLLAIQSELQAAQAEAVDAATQAALLQEEKDVREKLRQLQTYRHMFEDADQQLAEFDNRIDNVNAARHFRLQRIRRLQRAARTMEVGRERGRGGEGDGEVSGEDDDTNSVKTAAKNVVPAPPSVRELLSSKQAYTATCNTSVSSLRSHPPTPPPSRALPRSPPRLEDVGKDVAHRSTVEPSLDGLAEETRV